jgi:hypothetical protein
MSTESDLVSALITAAMVAMIRLIEAWMAVEAGVPLSSLAPRSLAELDAEATAYVDRIRAARSGT